MSWLDRLLNEAPERCPLAGENGAGVPGLDPTLEALCSGLPPEDAQALREERAAILEYEAGLSREEAERRAGLANAGIQGAA